MAGDFSTTPLHHGSHCVTWEDRFFERGFPCGLWSFALLNALTWWSAGRRLFFYVCSSFSKHSFKQFEITKKMSLFSHFSKYCISYAQQFFFFRTDEADSPPNLTLRLTLLHIRITNQFISRGGLRNNLMLPKVGNRKIMTRKYVLSGLNEEL